MVMNEIMHSSSPTKQYDYNLIKFDSWNTYSCPLLIKRMTAVIIKNYYFHFPVHQPTNYSCYCLDLIAGIHSRDGSSG